MSERTGHLDALKERARTLAEDLLPDLFGLARELHDAPELSGEEHRSSRLLATRLQEEGFRLEPGAAGLPTAFVARSGSGARPVLAFLAEYDALPGIGHGCGHNLIAAAALGAGTVLSRIVPEGSGEIRVVGTPAEETLGGKVILVEKGVFADVDAAMMVHPAHEDRVLSDSLACQSLEVTYLGRGAHAVVHPDKGINALDALLALFTARDALLRRSGTGVRLPGIISEGGVRPNMVPERAVGRFSLRTPTRGGRDRLAAEFRRLALSIGEAHRCGCQLVDTDRPYDEMVTNTALADAYRTNLRSLGVTVNDRPRDGKGSLDMGNVSYAVPSLHPFFAIVPAGIASHTREFAEASVSEAGRAGLLRSVRALAMTGLDFLLDPDLGRRAADEHRRFRDGLAAGET